MEEKAIVRDDTPDHIINEALREHSPVATWCLFSGGNDSGVLAHRCWDYYEQLLFIDTGTAVPGVVEFVKHYADWLEKPLRILNAGDAYRQMVLGTATKRPLGFPGPGQHRRAYIELKERQIDAVLRESKTGHPRSSRVVFLSGVRRAESSRRAQRVAVHRRNSAVFVSPLLMWSAAEMLRYRREHELPQSDVAALLHRSGECNCGAFAQPGERAMLAALWPSWFDSQIAALEHEAASMGLAACRWGTRPSKHKAGSTEPLCTSCQWRS